jgi:hypothetical protein
LQSHLFLGTEIDRVYREAVGAVDKDKLMPLCRRERLRRLSHEELLAKEQRFPFVPALLMSENELRLLDRLQDPEKTPGLGGKARSYMNSMAQAENELHASVAALEPVVRRLATELVYEQAVFASERAAPKDVPADPIAKDPAAVAERCALHATYAVSPNKARFLAQQIGRLSGEAWPAEPERSGLLAFLYAQADVAAPKEAIASGVQMSKLWTALSKLPPAKICAPLNALAPAQAVDGKAAAALAATLLAE